MNIESIKSFLDGQTTLRPDKAIDRQLQQQGLKQAQEGLLVQRSGVTSQFRLSFSAISESLRTNVKLDGETAPKTKTENEIKSQNLFDFEEIADNVMKFVGGVIRGAAQENSDNERLSFLFQQAREGVAKGIAMAREELAGSMTDELDEGINNVESSLSQRIDRLERDIMSDGAVLSSSSTEISQTTSLVIRTADGDEVSISLNKSSFAGELLLSNVASIEDSDSIDSKNQNAQLEIQQFFQSKGLELTVAGDLDDGERVAIGALIEDIYKLADEFFNGDVQGAFENAKSLGFDESEIAAFSFTATQTIRQDAINVYGDIGKLSGDEPVETPTNSIITIKDYVSRLLETMEVAASKLEGVRDFGEIVNGVVNTFGDDVKTPDIVSAINAFYRFNNAIIESVSQQDKRSTN